MPLVRAQFVNLKYDIDRHRKVLDEDLKIQTRQAARAWLRATFEHVPVWTGMARGSLKPLGRYLRVAIDITPHERAKPTPSKNQAAGEAKQHFVFNSNGYNYSFQWSTDVLHYQLNEFHQSTLNAHLAATTPWHSTQFGNAAWDAYVRDILPKRLPNCSDFIQASIIRIDRS